MKFISLIDTRNHNIITIDATNLILRIEIDEAKNEIRLKSYMALLLYELFNNHPRAVSYEQITDLLKQSNFIITDSTRMHRKLSEIRNFISKFHPCLKDLILNTRGVGYSLPLSLKSLYQLEDKNNNLFKNAKINKIFEMLENLVNEAIEITAQNKVVKYFQGYIINREKVKEILVEKINLFEECQQVILEEIRLHEVDFTRLRIDYCLAKLKTYIGLARISEYPISETQWLDWFKHEIWLVFNDLKKLIKSVENM